MKLKPRSCAKLTIGSAIDMPSRRRCLAFVPDMRLAPSCAPDSRARFALKSFSELVPDAVNEAIVKHELNTIGEPDVHLDNTEALEKFGEQPISVKVNVEVLPKVELKDYKGIEAVRQTRPIDDENVDEMLEALRETSAAMQPVEDRGAELGDTVTINVEGKFVDEPEEENIKADDVEVTLGGKGVQQEFTDNLIGR